MMRKMHQPIGNANDENSPVKKRRSSNHTNDANDEDSLVNNIATRFGLTYKPPSGFFFSTEKCL